MTGRTKRKPRKSSFALPLLAFGAVLLTAAAVLFLTSRPSGPAAAGNGGSPQIAAEPAKIDYGYVKLGTEEQFKIKVTNTGTGILQFAEAPYVEVLEGC